MKKQTYFAPETTCVYVETESPLCQSGNNALFEGFDSLGMDFPMFPTSI